MLLICYAGDEDSIASHRPHSPLVYTYYRTHAQVFHSTLLSTALLGCRRERAPAMPETKRPPMPTGLLPVRPSTPIRPHPSSHPRAGTSTYPLTGKKKRLPVWTCITRESRKRRHEKKNRGSNMAANATNIPGARCLLLDRLPGRLDVVRCEPAGLAPLPGAADVRPRVVADISPCLPVRQGKGWMDKM